MSSLSGDSFPKISTTMVNSRFQETPLQDIKNYYGKITVPGVGPRTAQKLCECNISTPSALVGQYMVIPILHVDIYHAVKVSSVYSHSWFFFRLWKWMSIR